MSQVKTCIQNVCLYPPRGMLHDLLPEIRKIVEHGEIGEWAWRVKLPSPKAKFNVIVVVDDECEVCPEAVKLFTQLARAYPDNFHVTFYNISYVKQPFPVEATPTIEINGVVRFVGIPLEPDAMPRYLEPYITKAYLKSHPKLKELLQKLETFAKQHGYYRNPYDPAFESLLVRLLRNIDIYGYPYCPCRPLTKPVAGATPEQIYKLNRDKICPCAYVHRDIKQRGHCLCGLFWSKEAYEKWIQERLKKVGWMLAEIRNVKKLLEDIEVRIVRGSARERLATIISKLQMIEAALDG